jgi:hypothetical protein
LFGGILLWMSVSIASPAQAVSTNYVMDPGTGSGFFNGSTFSLDTGAVSDSFTAWNIISVLTSSTWSDPLPVPVSNEEFVAPSGIFLLVQNNLLVTRQLTLFIDPASSIWIAKDAQIGGPGEVSDSGTLRAVPEPASLMLLGAGLAGIGIWRRKAGAK